MDLLVGTSGYSYKEWVGDFYPPKTKAREMLPFYASRFRAVESNYTFYKFPSEQTIASWVEQTPESFRYSLKAPFGITHRRRLKDAEKETELFLRLASALGNRLGPALFQLPPNFKKDLARLDTFLTLIDGRIPAAFEFRHPSWDDADVIPILRAHSAALCLADEDDEEAAELVETADWGYVRLRKSDYSDESIASWAAQIQSRGWARAYVFFKHEDTGRGPRFATRLLELLASGDPG